MHMAVIPQVVPISIATALFLLACGGCNVSVDPTTLDSRGPGRGHFMPAMPTLTLLADGRKAALVDDFTYVDPGGARWTTPAKWEVDGASIPRTLWRIIGGPWDGPYRYASIIHDYYCDRPQGKKWEDVHRMYYEACLDGGYEPAAAGLMYYFVDHFGPRWDPGTIDRVGVPLVLSAVAEQVLSIESVRVLQRRADAVAEGAAAQRPRPSDAARRLGTTPPIPGNESAADVHDKTPASILLERTPKLRPLALRMRGTLRPVRDPRSPTHATPDPATRPADPDEQVEGDVDHEIDLLNDFKQFLEDHPGATAKDVEAHLGRPTTVP